LINRLF